MKNEEKQKAREMRKQGHSMNDISKTLGVSKGSVSLWTKDINLTDKQVKVLWDFNRNPNFKNANDIKSKNAREKRHQFQLEGRKKAKEKDWLHSAGCMLYWAEGWKSNNRNTIKFSNSDIYMLKLFIKFLNVCFDIPTDSIKWKINCYTNNGFNVDEIKSYWINELGLSEDNLGKVQINKVSKSSKRKRNTLNYGTVHLVINSTKIIQHIYGAIQEYGQFKREEYLG